MFRTSGRTKAVGCAIVGALVVATGSARPRFVTQLPRGQASVASERRHPTVAPHRTVRHVTVRPRLTGAPRVAYLGDSPAYEAQDQFAARLMKTRHAVVHTATFGGTAICDWFERM